MANINVKALAGKLNPICRRTLEGAAGMCLSRSNYNVEIEHWLVKLLESSDTDLTRIFRHYDIDAGRVSRELTRSLDQLRTGNSRAPELSLELISLMREAWVLTSLEFNASQIRSGFLLTALLTDRSLSLRAQDSSRELAKIQADRLQREVRDLVEGTAEDTGEVAGAPAAPGQPALSSRTPSLDQFTLNLSERARKREIDPVVGRDFEIRQVIDILTRRRQNNPILTGEAGVGKTAVVEGFALRVVSGDVPEPLRNIEVRALDLGLLQAGAGVRGEFENRLKGVISEVKASPRPVILFIDEAHTLIGAGGAGGHADAANMLKPALARGELRTIAATTWGEYKEYFDKDAALKRRFQVVKVDEPPPDLAMRMMRGLAGTLERHHKVRILEEGLEDAVLLSHRYITERHLPDKAVSLLDTACARVALSQSATPPALDDCQREIDHLQAEIAILKREDLVSASYGARLEELEKRLQEAGARQTTLKQRWEKERQLIERLRALRKQLEAQGGEQQPGEAEKAAAREEYGKLRAELTTLQGEEPLVNPAVDSQAIAEVVSGWTGIPVGKMVRDEIKAVLALRDKLEERVIGQTQALEVISQRIRTARANLSDPRRPVGVFLLVGPSGVGKTETALTLAEILYGGDRNLMTINMSEYKEEHKISRLTGSAPGYVGYGKGGVLTEAVRRKPYSIVLLDEVEKANESVQEIFYQVFDKGTLQDDMGNEVNFKNTIIILTSNVGTETIMKVCADPDTTPNAEGLGEALRPDLLKVFKPALLGRLTVVPFFPLSDEVIRSIIRLQLGRISERIRESYGAQFTYEDNVVTAVAGRCREVESGARNLDHIISGTLLPELSSEFLTRMAEGVAVQRVHVSVNPEGKFCYEMA
jgi:type VI secretion system protein VasG